MRTPTKTIPLLLIAILGLLMIPPLAHAGNVPILHNTSSSAVGSSSTLSTTATQSVTQNDILVVMINDAGDTVSTVSDGSNTYTKQARFTLGGFAQEIWTATATGTASLTVTVTLTVADGFWDIIFDSYTGSTGLGTFATNTFACTSTPCGVTTTATTVGSNSLLICGFTTTALGAVTYTPGSGQTTDKSVNQANAVPGFSDEKTGPATPASASCAGQSTLGNTNAAMESFLELKGVVPAPTLPTISAIAPTSGVNGLPVTITGTNLNGATTVTFCGDTQQVFTIVSSTSITTFAPNRTPQLNGEICDIQVTTSAGSSALSTSDQFQYLGTLNPGGTGGGLPQALYLYVSIVAIVVLAGILFVFVKGRRSKVH